jgi:hypothetical protein
LALTGAIGLTDVRVNASAGDNCGLRVCDFTARGIGPPLYREPPTKKNARGRGHLTLLGIRR